MSRNCYVTKPSWAQTFVAVSHFQGIRQLFLQCPKLPKAFDSVTALTSSRGSLLEHPEWHFLVTHNTNLKVLQVVT